MTEFIPGQRWVSATEPELGLGIVQSVDSRRVDVAFPAADEIRIYALGNTPLSRVEYKVGERVQSDSGETYTVIDRLENNGNLIYLCTDSLGTEKPLPESELDSTTQFSKAQDRLFAGQIDDNAQFELRCETLIYDYRQRQLTTYGLLGPRVQILPHQFFIACEVAKRHAPRVLLADEVGLGKTIEAGLIIHHQLINQRISRVLVIVPDALIYQWLVELLRRFNLRFTILDIERCDALDNSGEANVFSTAQLVLSPLSLFTTTSKYSEAALSADWDLLVVDEAHHLQPQEGESGTAYQYVEKLAGLTGGMLLLTATPEQLGNEGHFARLRLLDPSRYPSLEAFRAEEANYKIIGELIESLTEENTPENLYPASPLYEKLTNFLDVRNISVLDDEVALDSTVVNNLISKLLDCHGTGRVLFRNTRATVGGFSQRRLNLYPLIGPKIPNICSTNNIEEKLYPETILGSNWTDLDPRSTWLADFLETNSTTKVLVICHLAQTAQELELWLRLRRGFRTGVFHEGLTLVARDRVAAYFSNQEDGAQVLICSEIGSEGRNFQFAHHLVLFDLPINPDVLEQRIGRLDRIGQSEDVQIHCLFYKDSAQEVLAKWYNEGFDAFESSADIGRQLQVEMYSEVEQCMFNLNPESTTRLVVNTRARADVLKKNLKDGRNRLLERHSFNYEIGNQISQDVAGSAHRLELSDFLERLLDQFGIEQQPLTPHSLLIRPTSQMLLPNFPRLPDEGISATFERSIALTRDDLEFLTWEHPLVTACMELVLSGEFGNNAFVTAELSDITAGRILLEAIYRVRCTAPKALQIERFLAQGVVRVLLDEEGANWDETLPPNELSRRVQRVGKRTAREVIKHAQNELVHMITKSQKLANESLHEVISNALEQTNIFYRGEIIRLEKLRKVNPNVRQLEIEYFIDGQRQCEEALSNAQMTLEALRVIVTT